MRCLHLGEAAHRVGPGVSRGSSSTQAAQEELTHVGRLFCVDSFWHDSVVTEILCASPGRNARQQQIFSVS